MVMIRVAVIPRRVERAEVTRELKEGEIVFGMKVSRFEEDDASDDLREIMIDRRCFTSLATQQAPLLFSAIQGKNNLVRINNTTLFNLQELEMA